LPDELKFTPEEGVGVGDGAVSWNFENIRVPAPITKAIIKKIVKFFSFMRFIYHYELNLARAI
jgi:hypothetical protein